jgi:hypothetical protein
METPDSREAAAVGAGVVKISPPCASNNEISVFQKAKAGIPAFHKVSC